MTDDAVLLLASPQYLNHAAILNVLDVIDPLTPIFVSSHRTGVGHTILRTTRWTNLIPVKWQPTRPTCTPSASRALLFWDGTDRSILRSLVVLRRHHVPFTIYDPDGNVLDVRQFYATLASSGGNGKMATTVARPSVIVDAPPVAPGESQSRSDAKVRLQLHIPESIVARYEEQAKAAKVSLEKVCSDRLRTCVSHTSGRGLYFNDDERSALERITGGHLINDATVALDRIRTTVSLKVGDITIELSERLLARASSRAKAERKSLAEYVTKEVIQGLERSVGIRPW